MRNNQPVSQREYAFPDQQRLISTTDLKGQITYCNDIFAEVSGFARDELIRAPHNLVRHPDVPPAVFEHMWTTLKQGKPWMGVVRIVARTVTIIGSTPTSRRFSISSGRSPGTNRCGPSRRASRSSAPKHSTHD